MEFKNLDQHKAFIKKEAKRLKISPNAAYSTYYAMKFIERLSLINRGLLVIKGSFSQYVHLGFLSRPILDVDLSSEVYHHVPINMLFESAYRVNDGQLTFELNSLPKKTANGVYKIPFYAKVQYPDEKELIIQVPMDFKENNQVIFETQFKTVEPLFDGQERFYVCTPSFEEHVAEKLYIISSNTKTNVLNTRVKDFYDIYMLHGKDYDPDKFSLYFQAMAMLYGKNLKDIDAEFLNKKFVKMHESIWESMKQKYEFTDQSLDLDEAVYYVKAVLKEQIQKIRKGEFTEQAMHLVKTKRGY